MWTYLTTPFVLAMDGVRFAAAQLTADYVAANGIRLPTKRRTYTRGPTRRPIVEMLMVSINISNVNFS